MEKKKKKTGEEEKKVGSSPDMAPDFLGNGRLLVIQALKSTLMLLQGLR